MRLRPAAAAFATGAARPGLPSRATRRPLGQGGRVRDLEAVGRQPGGPARPDLCCSRTHGELRSRRPSLTIPPHARARRRPTAATAALEVARRRRLARSGSHRGTGVWGMARMGPTPPTGVLVRNLTRPGRSGPATALVLLALVLAGCSTRAVPRAGRPPSRRPRAPPVRAPRRSRSPRSRPRRRSPRAATRSPRSRCRPISVLGLAEQRHRGDRLRLGAVREQTAAYTSYDITYRSRSSLPGAARRATRSAASSTSPPGAGRSRRWCSPTATSTPTSTSAARG